MLRRSNFYYLMLAISALNLASASAATYYVDQTLGNDNSSGTSPTTPWRNCPWLTGWSGSATLHPGDTVYFNRGGTWLVNGSQGIYLVGGVTYDGNSWGVGNKAVIRANGDCDSGVVRFRDDPTHETVFKGFEVDANHTVSSGIDINHAHYTVLTGATKRVQDCEVHHTYSEVNLGQYKYGVIVSNHGGVGGYCENVEIINTVVHDTSRDAICLYPGDENANCRIKNITVRGCEAYNTGQDPGYGAGAGILVKGYVVDAFIDHNYTHNTQGATMFINGNESNHFPGIGPTNINIRYNVFTCNNGTGAIRIYDGNSGKDPKTVKIYGNLLYNSTSGGGLNMSSDLGNTNSIQVYNNTFYNAPVYITAVNATFSTLEFKNNIVYSSGQAPVTDSRGQITSHADNIYYGSGTLVSSAANYYNSGNLKTSYEPSASVSDPLFKNASSLPTGFVGTYGVDLRPNTDGLSLQAGSYGLDHGMVLAMPYNGSINTVTRPSGAAPDIGAYEYGSAALVTPSLTIAKSGANIILQWPANILPNWTAQQTTDLLSGWSSVTAIPVLTNGVWQLTVPRQSGSHFFRLHLL
jgi:hypothetical protein